MKMLNLDFHLTVHRASYFCVPMLRKKKARLPSEGAELQNHQSMLQTPTLIEIIVYFEELLSYFSHIITIIYISYSLIQLPMNYQVHSTCSDIYAFMTITVFFIAMCHFNKQYNIHAIFHLKWLKDRIDHSIFNCDFEVM